MLTISIRNYSFLYTDHLITARLATNNNGIITWRWEGKAFGNTQAQELAGVSVNLRFPGQYYDSETNLHYNWNRYYDPSLGRYITSDPIGINGGLNTYSYAMQNPIYYTDPLGLAYSPRGEHGMPMGRIEQGPFGPICGPEGSPLATWIVPDIYKDDCIAHDKCYEDCSKTKQECDEEFKRNVKGFLAPGYHLGISTARAQKQYDKAQAKCNDQDC